MSSVVIKAMEQISQDLEDLIPPDRMAIRYKEIGGRNKQQGTAGDRAFFWSFPKRIDTELMQGAELASVRWSLSLILRISQGGRSYWDLIESTTNEMNLIMRTIDKRETWPSGVLQVTTESADTDLDEDNDDVLMTLNFMAFCEESDG